MQGWTPRDNTATLLLTTHFLGLSLMYVAEGISNAYVTYIYTPF